MKVYVCYYLDQTTEELRFKVFLSKTFAENLQINHNATHFGLFRIIIHECEIIDVFTEEDLA